MEIFTAKVPVTYTNRIEEEGMTVENTAIVGYLFTPNLLWSMKEHKKIIEELLRK